MSYVHLTDVAIEAFHVRLTKRKTPDAHIRLGIKGGSCEGYKYDISFEDDGPRKRDIQLFYNGIRVLIDPKSMVVLNGSTLTYENTLMESGFRFTNSREKSRCGCGESFSI